ncbi:MAG: serine/threonine-protein phosphatase [Deltaproteobacteria bacterium]|nr:serine/threonine-protein phosphatase [Deltaproteobacteria bacterium]
MKIWSGNRNRKYPKAIACFLLEHDFEKPQHVVVDLGHVYCFLKACPGENKPSEDAGLVYQTDELIVLAVADGVGGSPRGRDAALASVRILAKALEQGHSEERDTRLIIIETFEKANQEILSWGVGAGSTLMVVLIEHGRIQSFHVGDSACLLVGQRGLVKYRSVDHSVVGYGQEAELLSDEEGMQHQDRHILLNCLGTKEMRIDIGPLKKLKSKDRLILGSDGLFDNLTQEELVGFIRKGSVQDNANQLQNKLFERMNTPEEGAPSKPDDVVFLMYGL